MGLKRVKKQRRLVKPKGFSKIRSEVLDKPFGEHTADLIKTNTGGKIPRKPKYDGKQHKDTARDFHKKERANKEEFDKIREENDGYLPRNPNSDKGKPKGTVQAFKPSSKRALWLAHFLNESNSTTFLNKANAAIAAGYKPDNASQIGLNNYYAMQPLLDEWVEEAGLSETALKLKLVKLLNAKKTVFFADKGVVTEERQVEDHGIQKSALDLAAKIKGMSNTTEVKHTYQGEINDNRNFKLEIVDGPGKPVEVEDLKKIGEGSIDVDRPK